MRCYTDNEIKCCGDMCQEKGPGKYQKEGKHLKKTDKHMKSDWKETYQNETSGTIKIGRAHV